MNLVGYVIMPIEKNGHTFLFHMPMGAPYADAKEVAAEIVVNVVELEKEAQKKLDEAKEQADNVNQECSKSDTPNDTRVV